jgi:Flp pilus assembly pilin Flp
MPGLLFKSKVLLQRSEAGVNSIVYTVVIAVICTVVSATWYQLQHAITTLFFTISRDTFSTIYKSAVGSQLSEMARQP